MEILQEVMDKARIGLPSDNVPLTKAKRHLASVWAGRAVAAAQVAGPGHIESVSLRAVGAALGRLLYTGDSMWVHERGKLGDFAFCASLLVPLYAARATEEVLYGRRAATLSTAPEIATAGRLARWLCLHSHINPAMWGYKTVIDEYSPITQYLNKRAVRPRLCLLRRCQSFTCVLCRLSTRGLSPHTVAFARHMCFLGEMAWRVTAQ